MKNIKNILALILITIFAISCDDSSTITNPDLIGSSKLLHGTWVYDNFTDDITTLKRTVKLDSSSYGFIFFENGSFLERKSSDWCGTPPISYANFSGTWTLAGENYINISVGYWGGITNYRIEVISISDTELKIKYYYPFYNNLN